MRDIEIHYGDARILATATENGLVLGKGAKVALREISMTSLPSPAGASASKRFVEIRAVITLTNKVWLYRGSDCYKCSICGAVGDMPDVHGMFYILQHAEEDRVVFARPYDCEPLSDAYPAKNFCRSSTGETLCFSCDEEIAAAVLAVKARRAAK